MPSLEVYKRLLSPQGQTSGQAKKFHSDITMEATWDNDIQSKTAYIYDYYHDDQPDLVKHMTHNKNSTKTKIDIKFIVNSYGSLSKDDVDFHIIFKPSQPVEFEDGDELYYYQRDYADHYHSRFPIGMFIDIPNDRGVYEKWLIVNSERGNQFVKYFVLPCNYKLFWIEIDGNKRIKRTMWCVKRTQSSYNSGLWTDNVFTSTENQSKIWLPLNPLTEYFYYSNNGKSQRLIVGALTKHPTVWKISKIENAEPIGIQKVTLSQDFFNKSTDYVNFQTGEMYADYYSSTVEPEDDNINDYCVLSSSSNVIKCEGSYKLITAKFYDSDGKDITSGYLDSITLASWTCSIDGEDFTSNELISWKKQENPNEIRIKIGNAKKYLTKVLVVRCSAGENISGEIQLEISTV